MTMGPLIWVGDRRVVREVLRKMPKNPGTRTKGEGKGAGGTIMEPPAKVPTLASSGIEKKFSSRAQYLASVPASEFEAASGIGFV